MAASTHATHRRTQRERSETTRSALVRAARQLFADIGYAATSLEQVASAAHVTKGGLYHHFAGKDALFRAVFEAEQHRLAALARAAYESETDPWEGFEAGCRAFLEESLDPGVQRITLLDAPKALGWESMRALETSTSLGLIRFGLEQSIAAGRLAPRPVEPLAQLLFGAICQAATSAAHTDDPSGASQAAVRELRRVFDALAR